MPTTMKLVEPVERAKSPIWGRPATAHEPDAGHPQLALQLEGAATSYKPVTKDSSTSFISKDYLNVPPRTDFYISPLASIVDGYMPPCEEKPFSTIRKRPRHSTYVYGRPLPSIKEYPHLEEFAARGWVNTDCKTKEGVVKEWEPAAKIPTKAKRL